MLTTPNVISADGIYEFFHGSNEVFRGDERERGLFDQAKALVRRMDREPTVLALLAGGGIWELDVDAELRRREGVGWRNFEVWRAFLAGVADGVTVWLALPE